MKHLHKPVSCPFCGKEQVVRFPTPPAGFSQIHEQDFQCINDKCNEHFSVNLLGTVESANH